MLAKLSGQRPSQLAGLPDDLIALDFDLAATYRYDLYERDARKQQAQMIIEELGKAWGGEKPSGTFD
jgi:hypothetical protein